MKHFEIAEANLVKLEKLWNDIQGLMSNGVCFGSTPEYEEKCEQYKLILPQLSKIDGWAPHKEPMEFDSIGQLRFEAMEIGEIGVTINVENQIGQPGIELRKYRLLLNQKRKELTRTKISDLIDAVDSDISSMSSELDICKRQNTPQKISPDSWKTLDNHIRQLDTLLGSIIRPPRWQDLQRHISYAELHDFSDVKNLDWPTIKGSLLEGIYDENDPIPREVEDLSTLVAARPIGSIDKLNWGNLGPEDFERLLYSLLSTTKGYENPQWLMHTNAPDKGRDLSVERVIYDSLSGVNRLRVIIQCKHWLSKSISVLEVQTLLGQMKLWEPPKVDVHIIATTGRFTADGVAIIEKNNFSDQALKIEMWPESHLEMILAKRPDLIAQFKLR